MTRPDQPLFVAFVVACAAVGCGDAEQALEAPVREAGTFALVSPRLWVPIGAQVDPFSVLRPEQPSCPETAYGLEDLGEEVVFSVDTADCDYIAVSQPSLVGVKAGDLVSMRLWHFALVGPEEAEAKLGVAFADEIVWREVTPIPFPSRLLTPAWRARRDHPAGTPVVFQVTNHGANSYSLIEVSVVIEP